MKVYWIFFACYLAPFMYANQQKPEESPEMLFDKTIYEWSKPFSEALHAVRDKYYTSVDPKESLIKATKAFISNLDPHSDFVDASEFKSLQESTQGEFFGIGVIIDNTKKVEQEYLTIIDVLPEGPAQKAGMRAHDKIIEIDGVSVRGMTVDEVVRKLKGQRGQKVQVKAQRNTNAELLDFTITRDIVKDQNALGFYLKDHNIFYLSLNMFTENSTKQVEALLKKCQTKKAQGLIIDLRNNTGGLLNAAIDIAGIFLPEGSLVVTTKNRDKRVLERYVTTRKPLAIGSIPIFIIVNNFTASAGEILPGCLRAHALSSNKECPKQIFIIGATTFGKGSVQEVIPTCHDCAIKLTTALYYLPDDSSIQGTGIKPDFIIAPRFAPTKDMIWFNKFFGQESALRNAIDNESDDQLLKIATDKKEEEKPKSVQERRQEQIATDYLILNTARLISMLSMAKKAFPQQVQTRDQALNFLKSMYASDDKLSLEEVELEK